MKFSISRLFKSLPSPGTAVPESIYDFKVPALDGSIIDFSTFRGKKILIVNTASRCGYTDQYKALEQLYLTHKDSLVVVGFPSNNFLFQEPGSDEQIAAFCKINYDVSFPLAAKISVRGVRIAPIYRWLSTKKYNKLKDSKVSWNFQKYLISETGELAAIFEPRTDPGSPEIIAAIEK